MLFDYRYQIHYASSEGIVRQIGRRVLQVYESVIFIFLQITYRSSRYLLHKFIIQTIPVEVCCFRVEWYVDDNMLIYVYILEISFNPMCFSILVNDEL